MSEGTIQYERGTMHSGANLKDADEHMFTLKIMICITILKDSMLLKLKNDDVNDVCMEKYSMMVIVIQYCP